MTNQRRIDANRPNAQLSTGPRAPQGKAAVRYNGLRHGITARHVFHELERRQASPTVAEINIDLKNQTQPPDPSPSHPLPLRARHELVEFSTF